jgi:hypothetical protein
VKCLQPVNARPLVFGLIALDASPQHDHERESAANAIASGASNCQSRRKFQLKFQSACNCFREHGLNALEFSLDREKPVYSLDGTVIAVSLN